MADSPVTQASDRLDRRRCRVLWGTAAYPITNRRSQKFRNSAFDMGALHFDRKSGFGSFVPDQL